MVFFSWFTGEGPNCTLTLESTVIYNSDYMIIDIKENKIKIENGKGKRRNSTTKLRFFSNGRRNELKLQKHLYPLETIDQVRS